MTLEQQLHEAVSRICKEEFGKAPADSQLQFQKTRKDFEGDLTLVVFPLLKLVGKGPEQAGAFFGEKLVDALEEVIGFNVVKGFLNLSLSEEHWFKAISTAAQNVNYGFAEVPSGKTMLVEYSSPNTNKPLHLGHLRNNFLGYSVSEILKANGHEVKKVQIINDRGIHICKSMVAWQKFGNNETPESSGLKGDHLVGKYYVKFDRELIAQAKELIEIDARELISEEPHPVGRINSRRNGVNVPWAALLMEYDSNEFVERVLENKSIIEGYKALTPIMAEAKEMLVKWESEDPKALQLWKQMNGWVYDGFSATYKRMGVDFDKLYYESDTYILGRDIVLKGLEEGLFFKKEDGSVWVDLSEDGLDEKLLLRKDGTSVYMTQDIGTAILRYQDFPSTNGMIYTVGNEQDYHFKVLFLILKKLGYDWANHCYHLSYGMVDLPTGKMKSREGTVVDADDLMDEMHQQARASTDELGKLEDASEEDKKELSEMIGLAALKYFLLKVDPKKRMMFDPEESIDFQGHTGPFIQYTHARIRSLIRKHGQDPVMPERVEILPEEKEVIKLLADYPAVIREAGEQYSPAMIANYTYELVKSFNQFYQAVPVLKEPDADKLNWRLILSQLTAEVIRSSMQLLGIQVPERM